MAIYFDYKLPFELDEEGSSARTKPCWSRDFSAEPLLATGVKDSLQIYSQEGELQKDAIISLPSGCKDSAVACLDWHPTQKYLCAGWRNGTVTFARSTSSSSTSSVVHLGQEAQHTGRHCGYNFVIFMLPKKIRAVLHSRLQITGSTILCVKFNPRGTSCVATDDKGVVSIYNTEGPRAQYVLHYRTLYEDCTTNMRIEIFLICKQIPRSVLYSRRKQIARSVLYSRPKMDLILSC